MNAFFHTWLPWLLSLNTIWMTLRLGEGQKSGWVFGLLGQLGWFAFSIGTHTWGLLPLNLVLTVLYWRNHRLWTGEERRKLKRMREILEREDLCEHGVDRRAIYSCIQCRADAG